MSKVGRNDPCPCGSGKKYKHCCFEVDRAAALAPAISQRLEFDAHKVQRREEVLAFQESQVIDAASNAVIDLIHAGRLDEAEQAARELLVRYPDMHDGWDRLGMVHEARGEFRAAADCYAKVVEMIRAEPERYDSELLDVFLELVVRLEASAVEAECAVRDVNQPG